MKVDIITSQRWGGPQTWARDLSGLLRERGIAATHVYKHEDLLRKLVYQTADLVHTTIPLPFKLWRKPLVFTVKGDYTVEKNLYQRYYPSAIKNADVVTVPSQFLKDVLNLPDAVVIPNAVFPEKFTQAQHQDRERIRLMTVANFYFPEKVKGLLKLWEIIQRTLPPDRYEWHIFGGGPCLNEARQVIEQGNYGNIHFRDFVRRLEDQYPAFDIFLYYSLHDNFPNVILEAMASGLPVVTNLVGAVREIVAGGLGYVTDRDDNYEQALRWLSTNTSLRKDIGQRARDFVDEMFNWHKIVGRYTEIYKGLVPVLPVGGTK